MKLLLICLSAGLLYGCASTRVYLPEEQCQSVVDRFRTELDSHQDPDAYRFVKALATFDEFKERYTEGEFVESGDDPFDVDSQVSKYAKSETEIRHDYDELLTEAIMDPNRLVEILPHVRLTEGTVLDYAYYDGRLGKFPVLYARSSNSTTSSDWATFTNSFNTDGGFSDYYLTKHCRRNPEYLTSLETDASLAAFFELALMVFVGEDFYRTWHATWMDRIFCTTDAFDSWIAEIHKREDQSEGSVCLSPRPPSSTTEQIRKLDFRPYADLSEDTVVISFVSLDDRSGVKRQWWTFSSSSPHRMVHHESETLIKGWNAYVY